MADTPTGSSGRGRGSRSSAQTPSGRITNMEPPSSNRPVLTPLNRTGPRDLANSVRRGLSASGGRNNNTLTPHARAAMRAKSLRRTALFTPGGDRRRSGRDQRETPMGVLQTLGRLLAPNTNVITSSSPQDRPPSSVSRIPEEDEPDETGYDQGDDDDDDNDLPRRPRFSLPIDEDPDDDTELLPPQSAGLEELDYTIQAAELPREMVPSRLSRGSLGSIRESDVFDVEDGTIDLSRGSDFFPPNLAQQFQAGFALDRNDEETRRITLGRESDFGVYAPPADEATTFVMSEPGDDMAATSPIATTTTTARLGAAGDRTGTVTFISEDPSRMFDSDDDDGGGGGTYVGGRTIIESPAPAEISRIDTTRRSLVNDPESAEEEDEAGSDIADETRYEDASVLEARSHLARRRKKPKKSKKRISRYGTEYPPLPSTFVKRIAQRALQSSGLSNTRMSADVVTALTQASDWFFEQVGDDLGAYADHAQRTDIDDSDVITLMRRQRQVGSNSTLFSLAQRHLPRELLQELRMTVPKSAKRNGYDDGDGDVTIL